MRSFVTGSLESLPGEGAGEDFGELSARIARRVVERQLTVPAVVLLESVKPLSFLGNQMLIFLDPMVSLVVDSKDYQKFVRMLEDRDNVEKLICAIEDENARESAARDARKAARRGGRRWFSWFRRGSGRGDPKGDGIGRQGDN
ncbi:MAG: hypothetical protein QUS11_07885 [Candidatus Fermentibacter sp.]|nr:hypothetical protein [Candidatus Fermentibacter sp.]